MTNSGDAAEQIVRMSLEGVEVAAKITGSAAKEIAIFLVAALKNKNNTLKPKGRERLTSMLKSGKPLEIFSVKDSDLKKFMQGAKQYGIVYCVLRNHKHMEDGLCDVMVKADDAPKISRLVERFQFATVDMAKVESQIVQAKAEKAQESGAEPAAPGKNDTANLLSDLLEIPEGSSPPEKMEAGKADAGKSDPAKAKSVNPKTAKTAKTPPSEPTLGSRSKSAGGTSSKPSVKEEIREITAELKSKREADAPKRNERQADTPRGNSATTHKQPQTGGKTKSKKSKER